MYVVCTCELGSPDPATSIIDCPLHGEPKETHTETSGGEEMLIDMEA